MIAMVRARRPWRAKFGARRGDDHQRRRRASFGEHLQEIERGRVGPVEVFEGEHERLCARPREQPGDHRGELAAPQLVGRKFRRVDRCGGNVEQGREQGRELDRIELHLRERGFEVGKPRSPARLRSRQIAAFPTRSADAAPCSATIAMRSIRPRNGASRRAGAKLIDESRLADSGLADDLNELPVAGLARAASA